MNKRVKELCNMLHEMDMKYETLTADLRRRRNLLLNELIREAEGK